MNASLHSLWYPYTPLTAHPTSSPQLIQSAQGIYLYGDRGQEWLDGIASWWCCLHGHRHPKIVEAMKEQMDRMVHVALASLTHEPAQQLADRLVAITPEGLDHVFFSDNGSTAIEVALKICWQRAQMRGDSKRHLMVSFEGAYHGDTLACMAISGTATFHHWFKPWMPEVVCLPSPQTGELCLEALRKLFQTRQEEVVAVVLEPLLQAAGGMLVHEPKVFKEIVELCQQAEVPFVADEIAVGLGRTGSLWAFEQAGVVPDLLCTSKGLTGGNLPLSATLVNADIFKDFVMRDDGVDRTFYHGHTYTGNPLACAAALASLDLCMEPGFLTHIEKLTQIVTDELLLFEKISPLVQTRQVGPVGVVEVDLQGSRPLLPVFEVLLEEGIYLRPLGNVFYFWPPLVIEEDEMRFLLQTTRKQLEHFLSTQLVKKSEGLS